MPFISIRLERFWLETIFADSISSTSRSIEPSFPVEILTVSDAGASGWAVDFALLTVSS